MIKFYIAIIITALLPAQSIAADTPATKPANQEPQFEENLYSLKDLTGVYIVLDYVKKSSEKSHLSVNPNLEQEIKKRLESVGLKLLTKDEMLKTPGNPQLDIYPNYPAHLSAAQNESNTEVPVPNLMPNHQCCYTSIWGSFSQSAEITRKTGNKYRLSTWGNGSNTDSCDTLGEWMSDATLKIIDKFIGDFKKSQEMKQKAQSKQQTELEGLTISDMAPETKYVKVKKADDTKGMTCDTAFMVYAQIFKKGTSSVSTTKDPLMEKLASHMLACKNYRYRIETRSDKGGNSEAQELLSARRAISLHNYLIGKGVEEEQFEMRFFGRRKTKSNDSEEDVIITPIGQ